MADQVTNSSKLPLFRGNGKDTITVEAWCEAVDRHTAAADWEAEDRPRKGAAIAVDALRESASIWVENVRDTNAAALTNWPLLRPLVIARFAPHANAAQRVRMIANLSQKNSESTMEFFDRVEAAMRHLNRRVKENIQGDHAQHITDGFIRVRDNMTGLMFVAGLRSEIRRVVESNMADNPTLAELREASVRAESAEGLGKIVQLAGIGEAPTEQFPAPFHSHGSAADPVAKQLAAVSSELAAVTSRLNQFTAGQRNGQKAAAGPRPSMAQRDWTWCFKCKQWGVHLRDECKLSAAECKKLTAQSRNRRPEGSPSDSQYPNF